MVIIKMAKVTHKFCGRAKKAVHRVADYIEDFSPLRGLPAFIRMEDEIKKEDEFIKGIKQGAKIN